MLDKTAMQDFADRARAVLPAGGLGNFDPSIFIREGKGARIRDEDGREYVDYLIGSGPMLLGHGHPEVLEAVAEQLPKGMTFFANNAAAVELAEEICRAVPCAEQVRFPVVGRRGRHVRHAAGARRHRARQDRQVRRGLPWHVGRGADEPCTLAPRQFPTSGGRQCRHPRGGARRNADRPLQRWPNSWKTCWQNGATRLPPLSSSRCSASSRPRRASCNPCARCATAMASCWSSTRW